MAGMDIPSEGRLQRIPFPDGMENAHNLGNNNEGECREPLAGYGAGDGRR